MITCSNIITPNWPLTTVARAMRRAGLGRGCMFLLNSNLAYKANKSGVNTDGLRVSR
jgi:hypothetical protein